MLGCGADSYLRVSDRLSPPEQLILVVMVPPFMITKLGASAPEITPQLRILFTLLDAELFMSPVVSQSSPLPPGELESACAPPPDRACGAVPGPLHAKRGIVRQVKG